MLRMTRNPAEPDCGYVPYSDIICSSCKGDPTGRPYDVRNTIILTGIGGDMLYEN